MLAYIIPFLLTVAIILGAAHLRVKLKRPGHIAANNMYLFLMLAFVIFIAFINVFEFSNNYVIKMLSQRSAFINQSNHLNLSHNSFDQLKQRSLDIVNQNLNVKENPLCDKKYSVLAVFEILQKNGDGQMLSAIIKDPWYESMQEACSTRRQFESHRKIDDPENSAIIDAILKLTRWHLHIFNKITPEPWMVYQDPAQLKS